MTVQTFSSAEKASKGKNREKRAKTAEQPRGFPRLRPPSPQQSRSCNWGERERTQTGEEVPGRFRRLFLKCVKLRVATGVA
jgi:hypothetical protein